MSSAESHLSLLDSFVRSDVLFAGMCVLFEGCVRGYFVIWGTGGRLVPCVYYIIFIIERTTLCMSICILLQLVIIELQLLCVS